MNSLQSDVEKPSASSVVLDASALLALILGEPGGDYVGEAVTRGTTISAVNLSETISKLTDYGWPDTAIEGRIADLALTIAPFDAENAWSAGILRRATRHAGLSFGDRACLALAAVRGEPALTADRRWAVLDIGVDVILCR